jgi:hypothetical protein
VFNDLEIYYRSIDKFFDLTVSVYRHKTINMLNCNRAYIVHKGHNGAYFKLNSFYLDKKLGELVKTRRPFFFWSKRKNKR